MSNPLQLVPPAGALIPKHMSKRISVNLAPMAEQALSSTLLIHRNWAYRKNTIIQAAIVAFSEITKEQQADYLRKVHRQDGRFV